MRVLVAGVLTSALLGGCGAGHGAEHARSANDAGGEAGNAARAPSPDALSYVELARASGALRGSAAAVAVGRGRLLVDRRSVDLEARRVAALRPRDPGLATLQGVTRSALTAALAAKRDVPSQKAAAVAAVSATDAINLGLQRYAAHRPQLRSLIPD